MALFGAVVLFAGWNAMKDQVETGVYPLVYPANFGNRTFIPEDNLTTKEGVYLGRLLFYEGRLSADNQVSCSSCHQQSRAFTDGKALSEGVNKGITDRNSMSLANLLWNKKLFWDGRAEGLEKQAEFPLAHPREMGQSLKVSAEKLNADPNYRNLFKLVFGDDQINGGRIVKAIAQFERTLISADSKYDRYLSQEYQPNAKELKGIALFDKHCDRCHGGPKTYRELFHNNGLDSLSADKGIAAFTGLETDLGRFKVPTLRNIELTAPYMHDGRINTLEEVMDHYSDNIKNSPALSGFLQNNLNLLPQEKSELIAFLKMLTDTAFINNPKFADPKQ